MMFAGQKFAVVGLGRNGLPAARALRGMGAEVIAWDDSVAAREAAVADGFTVAEPAADGRVRVAIAMVGAQPRD